MAIILNAGIGIKESKEILLHSKIYMELIKSEHVFLIFVRMFLMKNQNDKKTRNTPIHNKL